MQQTASSLSGDVYQQHSFAIDGRPTEDASKVNWNHLRSTFRPRSGKPQPQQPDPADVCSGSRAPAALAARPKSAGFPTRSYRRARRRGASAEEAAAAAAAAEDSEDLAEMWRIDDEDAVELDDIFDQLTRRGDGVGESQRKSIRRKQQQQQKQKQQQQQRQQQRQWRPSTAASRGQSGASRKSATQLYQEHLLAEVAKHRLKAASAGVPRPLPPELTLFIPKTRTRLCRLYTGPCLLRGSTASPSVSAAGFLPIARPLVPLPAELRPLSRQGWSSAAGGGGPPGGAAQVSGDACNCVGSGGGGWGREKGRRGGRASATGYSQSCAVCQRLRMLQLA